MFYGGNRQLARGLLGAVVFFLASLSANVFAAAPADETNAVWVLAEHGGVLKLAQSDATLLHVIDDLPAEPVSLAVDNKRFIVWIATDNRQLHAYNFSGVRQFSVPIVPNTTTLDADEEDDVDIDEDLDEVVMAVDAEDGAVWLGDKKLLYKFGPDGTLINSWYQDKKVRSLDMDQMRRVLWVVTKKGISAIDPQGAVLFYIDLGSQDEARDVDVDPTSGSLWVGIKKELRRYSAAGALELQVPVDHISYLAAAGDGNVWLNTKKELKLYSATGALLKTVDPFAGNGQLEDLAVNSDDLSVWLLDKKAVVHVGADGTLIKLFSWSGDALEMLKLSFDRTPPVIDITSPIEGAKVIPQPTFSLTYSDEGSGVDTSTIQFSVNGQATDFACSETATGSDCVPNGAFSDVDLVVSVTVTDYAGNVSEPATVNLKLDSDGDGYTDDVDAFPLDPNESSDLDGDGIGDNSDPDKDGDGYNNDVDAFPDDPAEWLDTDGDGIGDNSDPDIDGDGHNNDVDAFPLDATEWMDLDHDGIGDNSDTDLDNDGVFNTEDAFPTDPTESADLDGDGIGDNSDPDRDGDNVANADDIYPDDPNVWKLPIIQITSPATLITVGASPITVSGTVDDTLATVTVNGVEVTNSGSFTAQVALRDGSNVVVARAVDSHGGESTASIHVTLDATPPNVTIQSPENGATVTTPTISVTGLVNDIVRGTVAAEEANVMVNSIAATVANRSYLAENVPLNVGANTITVSASDNVGNTDTATVVVNFIPITGAQVQVADGQGQNASILTTLPQPLAAKLLSATGTPVSGREVIFRVIEGDGKVGNGATNDQRAYAATTDGSGIATAKFTLGSRSGKGNHRVRATAVGFAGEAIFHASAEPKPGNKISVQSGNNQRGAVLSPLPQPFVVTVTDEGANVVPGATVEFRVTKGSGNFENGEKIVTKITDSDGRASAHLALGREHGYDVQRVDVSLAGTAATAGFTASALMPGDPGQTRITGVVLNNQDEPLPGVTVHVRGSNRQAVSDASGQFIITEAPVGPVHLLVEGQTTSVPGDWPTLAYNLVTVAGADNKLPAPVYLLPLNTSNAVMVGDKDATLTIPEVPGFELTVKAGSATFPDGSKTGKMSVTAVNSSKVPMPPPNGMQPQFIVTIQPVGTSFDPPAALQLPNVDGYSPGTSVEMFSFDHDLEEFVTIGWGTVSEDGKLIRSNIGVGVLKAGWHCGSPPIGSGSTASNQSKQPGFCPIPGSPTVSERCDVEHGQRPGEKSFWWSYNSQSGRWIHNYDRRIDTLNFNGPAARVSRHDGRIYYFRLINNVWQSDADVNDKLEQLTSGTTVTGWRYTTVDNWIEEYDPDGRLIKLITPQGLTRTLEYDADTGLLTSITYPSGGITRLQYDGYERVVVFVNQDGRKTGFIWDNLNNLTQVIYPDNTPDDDSDNDRKIYHYENTTFPNHLTGITNENNVREVTYGYDVQGRRNLEEHVGGRKENIEHLPDGSSKVTDHRGVTRTFKYQEILGIRKLVEVVGSPCLDCGVRYRKITYDARGNRTQTEDFNGVITNYVVNSRNLETSRTEAVGTPEERTVTTEWHATFRKPSKITEPGRVTSFTYDAQGRLTGRTVTDPATSKSRTVAYGFNAKGLLTSIDGPRTDVNDVTTFEYDAINNRTRTLDPLGHAVEVTAFDPVGRPLSMRDANSLVTTLKYDPRGRLVERNVGGSITKLSYDGVGNLINTVLPDNSTITYEYDTANRLTGIRDGDGNRIAYTLDADGNRVAENTTDAGGTLVRTLGRTYNELNQLVQTLGGENQSTSYGYDAMGNRTSLTDPLTRTTQTNYDALNRVVSVIDPATHTTSYGYDARDNLVAVTDPRGLTTQYTYDGLNNLTQQNSPDTGTTYYAYDAAGNRTARTDAKNQNTGYSYDALNRLTKIDYPGTADDVTLTYDQGTNGTGRLTKTTDASGATDYAYDKRGNLIHQSHDNGTVLYGYDSANRIISQTYPSGRRVSTTYDALGRISRIATTDVTGHTQILASNMTYQAFGPRTGMTYGNGLVLARQFDQDGRLTAQAITGSATVQSLQFTYNAADNLINKTNLADSTKSQTYGYDALDRLTSAQGTVNETYAYAAASNRLVSVDDGTSQTAYQFDANGNTTAKGAEQFVYNPENRLKEYRGPTTATYVYNAQGQRTAKQTATGTMRYVYNQQGQLIGEYGNNASKEYVYLDGEPLAIIDNNRIYYVHNDHLATPQQMTDQSQTVVWAVDYKPFGEVTTTTNTVENNLRFPGQYFDAESGNHYNYFRDYDPGVGRYNTSDPKGVVPGGTTVSATSASIYAEFPSIRRSILNALLRRGLNHTYIYVTNNPHSWIDPIGLERVPVVDTSMGVQQFWYGGIDNACATIPGACGDYHERIRIKLTAEANAACVRKGFSTKTAQGPTQIFATHFQYWLETYTIYQYGTADGSCEPCQLTDFQEETIDTPFPHPGTEGL